MPDTPNRPVSNRDELPATDQLYAQLLNTIGATDQVGAMRALARLHALELPKKDMDDDERARFEAAMEFALATHDDDIEAAMHAIWRAARAQSSAAPSVAPVSDALSFVQRSNRIAGEHAQEQLMTRREWEALAAAEAQPSADDAPRPVATIHECRDAGGCMCDWFSGDDSAAIGRLPVGTKLYAGAPPADARDGGWNFDMSSAPHDHTIVELLISPDGVEHPLDDSSSATWTIGHNGLDHTTEDRWRFAGWDWSNGCYTEGVGTPIAWRHVRRLPAARAIAGASACDSTSAARAESGTLKAAGLGGES